MFSIHMPFWGCTTFSDTAIPSMAQKTPPVWSRSFLAGDTRPVRWRWFMWLVSSNRQTGLDRSHYQPLDDYKVISQLIIWQFYSDTINHYQPLSATHMSPWWFPNSSSHTFNQRRSHSIPGPARCHMPCGTSQNLVVLDGSALFEHEAYAAYHIPVSIWCLGHVSWW